MVYLCLAWEFLQIGLFAIGGGLAALPFLHDLVDKYHWFSLNELADMVAVAESTPGPIGLNMATYAGYQAGGVLGGVVASVALILPSLLISLLVCHFLARFSNNRLVRDAFIGLRPAVAGLISAIGLSLISLAVCSGGGSFPADISLKALLLFAVLLAALFIWKKHPLLYIAAGALAGIVFKF